jgi:hypothetical protein
MRIKKTIWRDDEGWQLRARGEYSYAVHFCPTVRMGADGEWYSIHGGSEPMDEKRERCSKCNVEPNSDMIGIWRLHNWSRL